MSSDIENNEEEDSCTEDNPKLKDTKRKKAINLARKRWKEDKQKD